MTVETQEENKNLLIGQETRLLGQLPVEKLQLVIHYTQRIQNDEYFKREQIKKREEWADSLPEYVPTKKELESIEKGFEDVKHGRVSQPIDPRDEKALDKVLGFDQNN